MPRATTDRLTAHPVLALLLVGLLVLAGCADDEEPDLSEGVGGANEDVPAGATEDIVTQIELIDFQVIVPPTPPAGEYEVINSGDVAHTFTAVDGAWDTGPIEPGDSATVTMPEGIHDFVCSIHPEQMNGEVTVGRQ